MTIPIVPGPFSFLREAGEGIAGILDAKRAAEERRRQEALETAALAQQDFGTLAQLVQLGILPRSVLTSPQALETAGTAGIPIGPETTTVPSAGEREADILGGLPEDQFRLARQIPSAEDVTAADVLRNQGVAEAMRATAQADLTRGEIQDVRPGTPQARAVAGVPAAGAAAAAEAGVLGGAAASFADQAAQAAVTATGIEGFLDEQGNVTPEATVAAEQTAIAAMESRGLEARDEFVKPFVAAALERRRFDINAQELQAALASVRTVGMAAGVRDDLRKRIQDQVDNANAQIKVLQSGISTTDGLIHNSVLSRINQMLAQGMDEDAVRAAIQPTLMQKFTEVQAKLEEIEAWATRAREAQDQLQTMLNVAAGSPGTTAIPSRVPTPNVAGTVEPGSRVPTPGQAPGAALPGAAGAPAARQPSALTDAQISARAQMLVSGRDITADDGTVLTPEQQLEQAVQRGFISAEDAAKIRAMASRFQGQIFGRNR